MSLWDNRESEGRMSISPDDWNRMIDGLAGTKKTKPKIREFSSSQDFIDENVREGPFKPSDYRKGIKDWHKLISFRQGIVGKGNNSCHAIESVTGLALILRIENFLMPDSLLYMTAENSEVSREDYSTRMEYEKYSSLMSLSFTDKKNTHSLIYLKYDGTGDLSMILHNGSSFFVNGDEIEPSVAYANAVLDYRLESNGCFRIIGHDKKFEMPVLRKMNLVHALDYAVKTVEKTC